MIRAGLLSSRSDWMTGTSGGAPFDSPDRATRIPRMPRRSAPAMSCGTLSPTITASAAATPARRSAFLEDRRDAAS